jgi:hypothetical protein
MLGRIVDALLVMLGCRGAVWSLQGYQATALIAGLSVGE